MNWLKKGSRSWWQSTTNVQFRICWDWQLSAPSGIRSQHQGGECQAGMNVGQISKGRCGERPWSVNQEQTCNDSNRGSSSSLLFFTMETCNCASNRSGGVE
jgi:hypothetical protein